uniref:Copper transport protein n=1 Tax=Panagrolaimus davidi TaxID=227884 RepID=A0A914PUH3_9BILA
MSFPSSMPSTSEESAVGSSSDIPGCQTLPDPMPFCTSSKHQMLLHFAEREFVLFSFWKTGSAVGMFGSCLLVILLCIASEAIELCRNFLAKEHALSLSDELSENSSISDSIQVAGANGFIRKLRQCFNSYRVTQATLYGLHILFGHVLILIIVSFNVWLLISVAIGKGVGYFLFKGDPIIERTTIALEAASPQMATRCRHDHPSFPSTPSSNNLYGKSLHSHKNSNQS